MTNQITRSTRFTGATMRIEDTHSLHGKSGTKAASNAGTHGNKFFVLFMLCLALFSKTAIATAVAPVVSSLSATRAAPGTTITISGSNFNPTAASNIVYFGTGKASVVSGNATSLTVTVPIGATYAPVSVTNSATGLTGFSGPQFQPTYNNSAYMGNVISFDTTRFYATGGNPSAIALGDIDGDGKADMAVSNFITKTMLIFRNTSVSGSISASSFASPVSIPSDTGAYSLAIGDLDGDGKLDIVATSNMDTGITVYRNTSSPGSISFAGGLFIPTPFTTTNGVVVGDLDGDGRSDIAVSFDFGVFTFRNTSSVGALSFDTYTYVDATGTGGFMGYNSGGYLAIGDLDGDGKKDLATNSHGHNQVVVLRNISTTGTISFATKQLFAVGEAPTNVAIGDLDGDGKPELAVTNIGSSYTDTGSVSVLRNTSSTGSIAFAPGAIFQTGMSPSAVAIASMAGGTRPDLIISTFNGYNLSVLRNTSSTGSLSFDTVSHPFYSGSQSSTVAVGDLDGDGKPDVAVSNYSDYSGTGNISVLRNQPLGLLTGTALGCTVVMDSFAAATPQGRWTSSDSSVAIAYTGIYNFKAYIQGISAGTATLTYTVLGGYTTATVVVSSGPPTAGTITGPSTVNAGANITLSNATAGGVWSASNGNATVSGAGAVHGVSTGTVTISYTVTNGCGWDYTTKVVTVNAGTPVTVSAITGAAFFMCAGNTGTFFDATPGGAWSINAADAAIASVSSGGVVTAIAAGTARLSYTVGSSYATQTLTVYPVPAAISGNASVCQGATTSLSDATAGGVWSSTSPSTATVSAGGLVTTINTGMVTINYSLGTTGCKASKIVTINANPAAITGPNKVCTGLSITLTDATAGGVWSGSNSYASINASGIVTGLAAGAILVTYTAGTGCLKTYNVNVNAAPAAILGNRNVCTGKVTFLSDPSTPGVSWTSGTPAVATINASGAVSGVSAGTTIVTYTHTNLCTATAIVTVNTTPTVLAISGPSSVSRGGAGITLTDATAGGVWSSSNTAILTVGSGTGLVTAITSSGNANINYIVTTSAGCSNFATKVISASPAPRATSSTTTVGAVISLANDAAAGEWTSSDNAVAAVDENGTVTALAAGNVNITHTAITDEGSASITVTSLLINPAPMHVSLVPNPNKGAFMIKGTLGTPDDRLLRYEITNMLGQIIFVGKTTAPGGVINEQVTLSNDLANGMYLLNVNNEAEHAVFHFVIEK